MLSDQEDRAVSGDDFWKVEQDAGSPPKAKKATVLSAALLIFAPVAR